MEFKVISPKKEKSLEETAQNALEQIKEKNYKEELIEAGISENNIKAYGFAFEGKNVLILGKVENNGTTAARKEAQTKSQI